MIALKNVIVNFFLFTTCITTCLILFSLKFNQQLKPKFFHKDETKIFDLNFKYLLNNNVCESGSKIIAIMIVTSYYGNVETRSAMRRSFSSKQLKHMNLRRVFLLGIAKQKKYEVSYNAILDENRRFGDLIQGNFVEAYRNLTYKHVMGLNWAATNCKNAKYVIKMDDDTVVNMHKISQIFSLISSRSSDPNLIAGYVLNGMVPIREPANKWFVTHLEFPKSIYPPFVSGWFYITTPKMAEKLVELSQNTRYFWIDDVYITGILAQKLKISHYRLNKIFAVHSEYLQCCIQDVKKFGYDCDLLVGPNGGDSNLFYSFNKVMAKCVISCVGRPVKKNINETCVAERKILIGKGKAKIETLKLF